MTEYVVSLWDFTGDSSLEQIAFVEGSLVRILPNYTAPPGWAYGVCEVGEAKGYFPLNYTEPYEPEKHTNIPPPAPVVEVPPEQQPAPNVEEPQAIVEVQPGEEAQPVQEEVQPVQEPIVNDTPQTEVAPVDPVVSSPPQTRPDLPPLTSIPSVLPNRPVPPSGQGRPTPAVGTPSSPVVAKPSPVGGSFSPSGPKPSPTTISPTVKPGPGSGIKPGPTSFSPKPSPSPGMGSGGSFSPSKPGPGPGPKPAPTSFSPVAKPSPTTSTNPPSARAAAPFPSNRPGGTPKPRPVSNFILNTPPPSQPLIRGRPAPGVQAPASPQEGSGQEGGGQPGGPEEEVTYCEALFDYTGDPSKNIFSFPKGTLIELKVKYDSGWWSGTIDGVLGYFPSNFVKELPPTTKARGRVQAATTDGIGSPHRRPPAEENRRKSLGAPMSRSVMTKDGGGKGLSLSHQDLSVADKRATLATPLTSIPGLGGAKPMPLMGMPGMPNPEEDKKKKGGLFSALKKKKKDKAQSQT